MENWKIIAASVAGTLHITADKTCQDSCDWGIIGFKDEVLIIVASDGAGSAKNGRTGAETTCEIMMSEARAWFEKHYYIKNLTHSHFLEWLEILQTRLEILADAEKLDKSDFASTLLMTVIQNEIAVLIQIGDGAIVFAAADAPENYVLAFQPQQGEYANTTNFVTDETAFNVMNFVKMEKRIEEISVFTDGLQRVALDYKTSTAHTPFFRSMLAPLRAVKATDKEFWIKLQKLQKQMSDFLDSPRINERTDDDKTLILASRS